MGAIQVASRPSNGEKAYVAGVENDWNKARNADKMF
jgi:hypothetical protein